MKSLKMYSLQIFMVLTVLTKQGNNENRIVYGPEVYKKFKYSIIKEGPDQGNKIIYNRLLI